jgi:hypothetical protein
MIPPEKVMKRMAGILSISWGTPITDRLEAVSSLKGVLRPPSPPLFEKI